MDKPEQMNHGHNAKDLSHSTNDTPNEFVTISEYIEKEIIINSSKGMHNELSETNVLFLGEENSGKTSLISLCLGCKEKIKPTIAPRFHFAQKDNVKTNIWEMGHIVNENIAAIPFMEKDDKRSIVMIVLDLSKPNNIITALVQWFDFLHSAISQPTTKNKETRDATKYDKSNHNNIAELPFPVIIVGNKYDKFKNEESVKRKVVCTALRYFTHITNSCLVFASTKEKNARNNFKKVARKWLFSNLANDTFWIDSSCNNDMPEQNLNQKNGPLLIYPYKEVDEDDKNNKEVLMKDIISSLPSKIVKSMNSIIDRHGLFYFAKGASKLSCAVDKWISLFVNIFGKDNFVLNNEKLAVEIKERLKLYPNEEIDKLRFEADEEIERLQRLKEMREN